MTQENHLCDAPPSYVGEAGDTWGKGKLFRNGEEVPVVGRHVEVPTGTPFWLEQAPYVKVGKLAGLLQGICDQVSRPCSDGSLR